MVTRRKIPAPARNQTQSSSPQPWHHSRTDVYLRHSKKTLTGNFSGRYLEKQPLGRPQRRQKDNIKMDLWEVSYKVMRQIELADDCPMAGFAWPLGSLNGESAL